MKSGNKKNVVVEWAVKIALFLQKVDISSWFRISREKVSFMKFSSAINFKE